MTYRNWLGIALCLALFGASFFLGDASSQLFNGLGLLIVLSGTLGAALLSYPFDHVRVAVRVALCSYTVSPPKSAEIVYTLMDLALQSRHRGILSLEEAERRTTVSFLRNALGMLVDGYRGEEIRDILTTEMAFFQQRRRYHERVFRHMARLAPAFGVCGSVIGLIGMLAGIGDTGVILRTIPVALTSTLYGILLANFVFTPVAENIHHKTSKEILLMKLVIDGVAAILEERNSHKLEKKLESFLTPAARPEHHLTFDEIRKQYYRLRAGA
jgi:chemotaxis protein MotA